VSGAIAPLSDRRTSEPAPVPESVLVALLCLAVALVFDLLVVHETGLSGDEPYYSRIAAHPAGPHNFPYAFRIGVPYLVHALPFGRSFSWQAVAVLAAAAAGGLLFALLRTFDVPRALAAMLSVGFTVSPPLLVDLLRNGREVDPVAILVITAGCLFIARRQRVALAVTLLVAATIHESCLFLIPFAYAAWARRPVDPEALRDVALAAALPLLLYLYLRTHIATVGRAYQPGYNGPFLTERTDVIDDALRHGGWHGEIRRLALSYGPLWLVAPLALRDLPFARRGLVLVACCVGAMTFALDWGRMAFFAAPVVYVAAAYAIRQRRRLAIAVVACLLAMDVGYAVYMQAHGVRHGLDVHGPPARGPVV
jgi:hypothetical protein